MELKKIEDVVGLKFQFFQRFENDSTGGGDSSAEGGATWTRRSLLGELNLFAVVEERRILFHSAQAALQRKKMGAEFGNLLFSLDFTEPITNTLFFSFTNPNNPNNCGDNNNDKDKDKDEGVADIYHYNSNQLSGKKDYLMAVECESYVYIYDIMTFDCRYIYCKNNSNNCSNNNPNEHKDNYNYGMLNSELFLVISDKELNIINVNTEENIFQVLLQEPVKLLSAPSSGKIILVASSGRIFLLSFLGRVSLVACELDVEPLAISELVDASFEIVGVFLHRETVLLALLTNLGYNIILICEYNFNNYPDNSDNYPDNNYEGGDNYSTVNDIEKKDVRLTVVSYCVNELFLLTDFDNINNKNNKNEKLEIKFKFVESWGLFIVYSNCSSSTLLITYNRNLIAHNTGVDVSYPHLSSNYPHSDNRDKNGGDKYDNYPNNNNVEQKKYYILMMNEGYNLESNEFDNFVCEVGLFSYRGEIYRKNSLQDTPTLRDPTMAALFLKSGEILIYCVDVWQLTRNNEQLEILTNFSYLDCLDIYPHLSSTNSADNYPDINSFNSDTPNNNNSNNKDKITTTPDMIDTYYELGFEHYKSDLKAFKLFESFSNVLFYFNSIVNSTDSTNSRNNSFTNGVNKPQNNYKNNNYKEKLEDYIVIINKLSEIQRSIFSRLKSGDSKVGADFLKFELFEKSTQSAELQKLEAKKKKFSEIVSGAQNFKLERLSEQEIGETEDALIFVNSSLLNLFKKIQNYQQILQNKLLNNCRSDSTNPANGNNYNKVVGNVTGVVSDNLPNNLNSYNEYIQEKRWMELIDSINLIYGAPLQISLNPREKKATFKYDNYPKIRCSNLAADVVIQVDDANFAADEKEEKNNEELVVEEEVNIVEEDNNLNINQININEQKKEEKKENIATPNTNNLFTPPPEKKEIISQINININEKKEEVVFGAKTEKLVGCNYLSRGDVEQKSVFSTFSSNKSLLDIATNFSSSATNFSSFSVGATNSNNSFPVATSFPTTTTTNSSFPTTTVSNNVTFTGINNFNANSFSSSFPTNFPTSNSFFPTSTATNNNLNNSTNVQKENLWTSSRRFDPLN